MKTKSFMLVVFAILVTASTVFAIDRSEIPDKYKWKPEHIYSSVEDWQKDFDYLKSQIDVLAAYKGSFAGKFVPVEKPSEVHDFGTGADVQSDKQEMVWVEATDPVGSLIAFNKLSDELNPVIEKLWVYVMYNYHVELANSDWSGMQQQIQMLYINFNQKLSWETPELLMIPEATMMKYVDENPELETYRKTYEDMYLQQAHVLSEQEEQIIAHSYNITGVASDVYDKLTDVDMSYGFITDENGDSIEVSDAGWTSWRVSKNRDIREAYFKKLWAGYDNFGTTLAALMNGNIKTNVYFARVRKYDNTLQSALSGNFIPEDVYINLVNTTRANLAPLHKYNEIRKRLLGVDHLRHWDYYASMSEMPDERLTWEEGVKIVVDYLKPMGKEYLADISVALNTENGWVDPFANDNKRGGAYSSSCYGVHPYMLYNFDYEKGLTTEDVSTIAHEVGHSMHTWYSEKTQPLPDKDYAIFNAEVASTTNEAIFQAKLLDEARKAYKKAKKGEAKEVAKQKLIALLEQNINSVRGTFYRQTMFATWEWEANKMGEMSMPLTKESLSELYYNLLKEFHGPAAEYEDLSAISWARIPHFYRGYYVYSYATSYAAAVALAKKIESGEKGAVEKYINYLKSGSSKHPVELLKDAGVDMTTPAPIEALVTYFTDLVNELDELTKG